MDLAPFRVTSPPTDITIYGYRGKHLGAFTVAKIDFADCMITAPEAAFERAVEAAAPVVDSFEFHSR